MSRRSVNHSALNRTLSLSLSAPPPPSLSLSHHSPVKEISVVGVEDLGLHFLDMLKELVSQSRLSKNKSMVMIIYLFIVGL